MSNTAEFLLELFSEEIPARMQTQAAENLKNFFAQSLDANQLTYSKINSFVTPRRMTLVVENLAKERPAQSEEKRGPRVGSPDQAIQGFLKSANLNKIEDAEVRKTDKGDFYFCQINKPALSAADILRQIICSLPLSFEWQKSMRWQGSASWIRPLRGVTAVFNGVPFSGTLEIGGMNKHDDQTILKFTDGILGHRFLSDGKPIAVKNFADYAKKLESASVIVDQTARRQKIQSALNDAAKKHGLSVRDDVGLLDEVTGLVEWPVVLIGSIDPEFMVLPDRVLMTSMRQHQKYFSLLQADGKMANKFAFVANIDANDGGKAIIAGNERVLRARLFDAKFFWEQDLKIHLEDRLPQLKDIVFHAKLGTVGQKVERLSHLVPAIAASVGADPARAADAAILSKADLVTGMVGEFPELQGYMGGEYARAEGEDADVATAIAEHYRPLGPTDDVPKSPLSASLALADKIDTLVGFFMAGEKPTGSKDPFALRRAALGIIRIILENKINLSMRAVAALAYQNYAEQMADVPLTEEKLCAEIMEFFHDRMKVYLRDQGIRHDVVAASLASAGESDLLRASQRAATVQNYLSGADGAGLLAAYRRAANIVRAEAAKDKKEYNGEPDSRLLQQEPEIKLFDMVYKNLEPMRRLIEQSKFAESMQTLSRVREPMDAFFDAVIVNTDDPLVRENRLRLLNYVRAAIDSIADFSKIEG